MTPRTPMQHPLLSMQLALLGWSLLCVLLAFHAVVFTRTTLPNATAARRLPALRLADMPAENASAEHALRDDDAAVPSVARYGLASGPRTSSSTRT